MLLKPLSGAFTGKRWLFGLACIVILSCFSNATAQVQMQVLGDAVDVSHDFQTQQQLYFIGNRITSFDAATGMGKLEWDRYIRQLSLSFEKLDRGFGRAKSTDFPGTEYDTDPVLPFSISFISPQTIRLRFSARGSRA